MPAKGPNYERNLGLTKAIIANAAEAQPLSYSQLSQKLGVDRETIYQLVSRLRRQGRLAPSVRQFTKASYPMAPDPAAIRAQIRAATNLAEGVMDSQERLLELSRLGRGAPDPVRRQAIMDLENVTKSTGAQIGPKAPLSASDKVSRLAKLMRMVGPELTNRARIEAFTTPVAAQ